MGQFKRLVFCALPILLIVGCARHRTTQDGGVSDSAVPDCEGATGYVRWRGGSERGTTRCVPSSTNGSIGPSPRDGFPEIEYFIGLDSRQDGGSLCGLGFQIFNYELEVGVSATVNPEFLRTDSLPIVLSDAYFASPIYHCEVPRDFEQVLASSGVWTVLQGGTWGDTVEMEARDLRYLLEDGTEYVIEYVFIRATLTTDYSRH